MSIDAIFCQIDAIADFVARQFDDDELAAVLYVLRQADARLTEELTGRANSRAYWVAKSARKIATDPESPGVA
jgi:hypothetical protein